MHLYSSENKLLTVVCVLDGQAVNRVDLTAGIGQEFPDRLKEMYMDLGFQKCDNNESFIRVEGAYFEENDCTALPKKWSIRGYNRGPSGNNDIYPTKLVMTFPSHVPVDFVKGYPSFQFTTFAAKDDRGNNFLYRLKLVYGKDCSDLIQLNPVTLQEVQFLRNPMGGPVPGSKGGLNVLKALITCTPLKGALGHLPLRECVQQWQRFNIPVPKIDDNTKWAMVERPCFVDSKKRERNWGIFGREDHRKREWRSQLPEQLYLAIPPYIPLEVVRYLLTINEAIHVQGNDERNQPINCLLTLVCMYSVEKVKRLTEVMENTKELKLADQRLTLMNKSSEEHQEKQTKQTSSVQHQSNQSSSHRGDIKKSNDKKISECSKNAPVDQSWFSQNQFYIFASIGGLGLLSVIYYLLKNYHVSLTPAF